MKITKNTTLKEVLEIKGVEKILSKHNVPCVTCPFARFEMEKLTLGDIAKSYNINLKDLIEDLKKLL
jgi:hypothetical protein